jgi:hypothetical protein
MCRLKNSSFQQAFVVHAVCLAAWHRLAGIDPRAPGILNSTAAGMGNAEQRNANSGVKELAVGQLRKTP